MAGFPRAVSADVKQRSLFSAICSVTQEGLPPSYFRIWGFIHTGALSSSFPASRLEEKKKKKVELCHHLNALSQKIRLPVWRNWFRRVSSVWRSVGFSTCDG